MDTGSSLPCFSGPEKQSEETEGQSYKPKFRGRGATLNPTGRFEPLQLEADPDPDDPALLEEPEEGAQLKTEVYRDATRSIVVTNDSPDVGMEATVNPYRGCEHGCIYCYARPGHEYFGLSAGLDFETKIFAKPDAPQLLREKLNSKSWEPRVISLSGVTDCYQPLERRMRITRGCLEVLADFRNPVAIITKNALVTRDIDVLSELAKYNAAGVAISITTLDRELCRKMEPRASTPALRLKALEQLSAAGIPTMVMIGPVLPGLTEHEIPAILEAAANAGAGNAHYTMLRLPYGVKDLFQDWLQEHYPDKVSKVIGRVKSVREGKLNDAAFGTRMTGAGIHADHIAQMFALYKKKYGLGLKRRSLSTEHFRRRPADGQLSLF